MTKQRKPIVFDVRANDLIFCTRYQEKEAEPLQLSRHVWLLH